MKRIIAAISILSLITMFSFGCTPTDTTKNGETKNNTITRDNATTRNNNVTGDYGLTGNNGTADVNDDNDDLVRDNVSNNPNGNINDDDATYRNPALGDTNKINSIENTCTQKESVDDASVAINDNTCYVGLDLENDANLSESMKEDLSTQIKRVDPTITRVYFTEDRSVIDNFVDSVKDTVDVDWTQLQNAFR